MRSRLWLLACVLAAPVVGAAVYYCYLRRPVSTVGVLIGMAIVAVCTLTIAPGEKAWWMLPALAVAAVLTVAALVVFLLVVCMRH